MEDWIMDLNDMLHIARAEAERGDDAELDTLSLGALYTKTAMGHAEVADRRFPLSRTTRTLLLVMDSSKSAAHWLGIVHSTSEADIDLLLGYGLIEMVSTTQPAPETLPVPLPEHNDPVASAIDQLTFGELYTLLTDQSRAQLGLIRGYRMVLEIERCTELAELRDMARRLLAQVRKQNGEAGETALRKALGI
jgi:hypothetical protein